MAQGGSRLEAHDMPFKFQELAIIFISNGRRLYDVLYVRLHG